MHVVPTARTDDGQLDVLRRARALRCSRCGAKLVKLYAGASSATAPCGTCARSGSARDGANAADPGRRPDRGPNAAEFSLLTQALRVIVPEARSEVVRTHRQQVQQLGLRVDFALGEDLLQVRSAPCWRQVEFFRRLLDAAARKQASRHGRLGGREDVHLAAHDSTRCRSAVRRVKQREEHHLAFVVSGGTGRTTMRYGSPPLQRTRSASNRTPLR